MKTKICLLSVLLVFSMFLSFAQNGQVKYSKVRISIPEKQRAAFFKLGITYDAGIYKDHAYIAELSTFEIEQVKKAGFNVIVEIDDMSKFYVQRNNGKDKSTVKLRSTNTVYPTPQHFKLGSIGGFLSYSELLTELDSMRFLFPNLISQKAAIGTNQTQEGNSIYYVRISNNPDVDENKPEILFTALTHSREPSGMQHLVFFMYYLLENYNTNDEVKYLVDNLEMYFIPCVSVDGYMYNCQTNPDGGGNWRKNRRNNNDGNFGVDLNRNYGFNWGYDDSGSSPNTNNDTYRGPSAFSEPEIQAVRDLTLAHNFKLALHYHAYTDLLIYPFGYEADLETPDSLIFRKYAQLMTEENRYTAGTPSQTVGYTGNGDACDWMYGDQTSKPKIFSFTPEAGDLADGFWPQIDRIETISAENVLMDIYLAHFALKYAKLSDLSSRTITSTNEYLKFNIQCLGLDVPASFTVNASSTSQYVQSISSNFSFSNLNTLDLGTDSIHLILNSNTPNGTIIPITYIVSNGSISHTYTFNKMFGNPTIVFEDSCNTIENWTSTEWNITDLNYYTAGTSITDSPTGNYGVNKNSSITTTNSINLNNAVVAYIKFNAKWDIEPGKDWVQLSISTNNGTSWIPLSGVYSKQSTTSSINGQPIYDGNSRDWMNEEIDISAYIGNNVKFKFTLKSDFSFWNSNYDGFYFDDFQVFTIAAPSNKTEMLMENNNAIFPNPCTDEVNFKFEGKIFNIKIYNSKGQIVHNLITSENKVKLENFSNGLYIISIENEKGNVFNSKLNLFK